MLACTSVLLALVAQAPPVSAEAAPEMVILPPKPEDGAKPDVAMQIWKATVLEVEKAKTSLGVSVRLQGEAKAALAGPARDQAWECKGEIPCLVELGHTLGAALVVAGSIDKEGVGFLVVDVKNAKKVVGAKSSKKLEKAGWQRQSKAAIKGVLAGFEQWRKAPPKAEPPPVALDPATAELRLSASELAGTQELTIDGLPIPLTSPDGVVWSGTPGRHVVIATRADGTRAIHELTLEGGRSLPLVLVFVEPPKTPATASPAPYVAPARTTPDLVAAPPPPEEDDGESPTSSWWFWVAMGAAVAAGGTTVAVLAGGIKGGVSSDSGRGSITGTY